MNGLDVIWASRDVVVINKPAGLVVHPGPRTPHSLEALLPTLAIGGFVPVAAHRLDRDTSGCLAIARSRRGARWLAAAFAGGGAEKCYWAILTALPAQPQGRVVAPLAKISSAAAGWRMVVDPAGKPAATGWRVLDAASRLVEFRPETGRTHQIRVHAAHIGCPIAGDPVYGNGVADRGSPGAPMRLHARSLVIPLPDGSAIRALADPPSGWPAPPAPRNCGPANCGPEIR